MYNEQKRDLYIIFGPPGSGKTTQAKYIAKTLHLTSISWGEIYRDTNKHARYPDLFREIDDEKTSNETRSSDITKIIDMEIRDNLNFEKGIILDGYPRRVEEAKLLLSLIKKHNLQLRALIRINPSVKKAEERFNSRYTCPICLRYYDNELNPPIKNGVCDYDGQILVRRTITKAKIEKCFYEYLKESSPAYELLKKHSQTYFDVSGEDDEIVIFSNILLKIKQKEKSDYHVYERKSSARIETKAGGTFIFYTYQSKIDYSHHIALVKGKVKNGKNVLVRVHSSCITGDIFGSQKCDCGDQLTESMKQIDKAGRGILIYLFQEGRGINIINKIKAYHLQNKGLDTVEANERLGFPAELREYLPVRDILVDLQVKTITLMTNNPDKIRKLTDLGIVINDYSPLEIKPGIYNQRYLKTKKSKMNHRLQKV